MIKTQLKALADRFDEARLLVVGDMMLDRFIWGKVSRISPEAPVPVVQVSKESSHLGGAANVVANIRSLGGQATTVGVIGDDEAGRVLADGFRLIQADTDGLIVDASQVTTQKTRIIAHHQQVVRVDREVHRAVTGVLLSQLEARLADLLPGVSGVIVSDYGKGVVSEELLLALKRIAGVHPISVDPKDQNFPHYTDMELIKPNQLEAERLTGITITDDVSLREAGRSIFDRLRCNHLLITRGEAGMALFEDRESLTLIPTRAREVYDVSGAGDTVMATYTMARSVGATPVQAALLANLAAGVVVAKLGTASLTVAELKEAIDDQDES